MKMTDVKVGMRLESDRLRPFSPITVTEITDKGFQYALDGPVSGWPRAGSSAAKDGHEHYGYEGETLYEPLPAHMEAARRVVTDLCNNSEIWATHGCPSEHKLEMIELAIASAILKHHEDQK